MDELSYAKDRLLGWACYRLDRIPQGLCLLRLRGPDAKPIDSMLLVSIECCLTPSREHAKDLDTATAFRSDSVGSRDDRASGQLRVER